LPRKNDFPVINKRVYVQPLAGKTQGQESASVDILGYRIRNRDALDKLSEFKDTARTELLDATNGDVLNSASLEFSYLNDTKFKLSVDLLADLETP
jgi:hypothetical protein